MKKKILIIGGIVLAIVIAIVAFFIVSDYQQREKLRTEFSEITELVDDGTNIDMDKINKRLEKTVANGNWEVVEKAGKQYLADSLKTITDMAEIFNDERIGTILTASNYETDGPDFVQTKAYISEMKEKLENCKNTYKAFFTEEKIMSYIEDKNLGDNYKNFYRNEIIGEIDDEANDKTVEESVDQVINLLNSAENIINFLSENKSSWRISNNRIVFTANGLADRYNELISEL